MNCKTMNKKILERLQELLEQYQLSVTSEERIEVARELRMISKMIEHNEKNTDYIFSIPVYLDNCISE